MSKEYQFRFICPLPNGIHARPASNLEQVTNCFESHISCLNFRNNKTANAKSILSLIAADIQSGDECLVKIAGKDSNKAYHKISDFMEKEFPTCDDDLPEPAGDIGHIYIPPVLEACQVDVLSGNPVVAGFARGKAVCVKALKLPAEIRKSQQIDPAQEHLRIDRAIAEQARDIKNRLASKHTELEKKVLQAHFSITSDPEFAEKINELISQKQISSGEAILQAFHHFSTILRSAQSELIRERVVDLQDVCSQLLKKIYGSMADEKIVFTKPSICIADNLTPSQFMMMDKQLLVGLVLLQGSNTSHTVILARSFGIPTLSGLQDPQCLLKDGQEVILDANHGFVIPFINRPVARFYVREWKKKEYFQQCLSVYKKQRAETRDGRILEVMANITTADEVKGAIENGAEGIGVFRTEMLFMDRDSAPDEQEQLKEYSKALKDAIGRPVFIRTFDIGGDKEVGYLDLPSEDNPFLGDRGVRIYKRYENLIRTQMRALLRASMAGNLKIMIPMVACVEEVVFVREILEQIKAQLDSESIPYDKRVQIGIMAEVPSVAFCIPQLAQKIDFVSIGTNDLIQYFLAADRTNAQILSLYQPHYPAFLTLIQKIIEDAHACGLWVGMCGEMAGQIESLPLLLGTQLDEVSVSMPSILRIKAESSKFDSSRCRSLLKEAAQCETLEQVESILASHQVQTEKASIIDVSMVDLDTDCVNKEEVIKYIADKVHMQSRTNDCVNLEKDLWNREKIYSTGLGYGIAIPHCKTKHIYSNTICVLRLRQPIEWNSIDRQPVNLVISMILVDSDHSAQAHMEIFSKLARSVMHEKFRQRLKSLLSPDEIVDFLSEKLALTDCQDD